MTTTTFTHHHTGLASATFLSQDAVWVVGEWCVFADASLLRYEVYIDGPNRRVFVHADTWESLDGPSTVAFQEEFIEAYEGRQVTEMQFLVTDSGPYGVAARAEAIAQGVADARAKDRLVDLAERADSLVIQAASLNQAPRKAQLQAFAVRHACLHQDLAQLEREMDRVRALVGLAGTALIDLTS